tara:strand:+ start:77 stop:469 length:393 start_codon:yes stop_codon:yes gene_type:complete
MNKTEKLIANKEIELICVYDADGSLLGELSYLWKKTFHSFTCSMCDITHNYISTKKKWKTAVQNCKYDISTYHLNDQPTLIKETTLNNTPCVVKVEDGSSSILISNDELKTIDGNVDSFFSLIDKKMTRN